MGGCGFHRSESLADLLNQSYGVKAIVLRNCHDDRLNALVASDIRSRTGVGQKDCLLVTVGNCKKG
jgi:hypothetical protein